MKPITNNIRRDWDSIQLGLFDGQVKTRSGTKMGNFYETMTACLFGGKVVKSPEEIGARRNGCSRDVVPDVICDKRQLVIESKGCQQRSHLNLYDAQVKGYNNVVLLKQYEVLWAIWRHGFKGIHKFRGDISDLYAGIAEKTYAGIILPQSIILALWEWPALKRYTINTLPRTSMRTKELNLFILDPDRAINRVGLDYLQYDIQRLLSPKDLMIENVSVPQFPIIVIRDQKPKEWVRNFGNEVPF